MRGFDSTVGMIAPAIQLAILLIFLWRKLYREFPFFYAYSLSSIVISFVRLLMIGQPRMFFVVYWSTEIIYGLLALAAIYEVFKPALRMYYSAHHWTRIIPSLALVILLSHAFWQAAFHPLGHTMMARLAAGAYAFVPGVLLMEAIVFVLCLRLAFKRRFPVHWGRYRLGILVGFGIAAGETTAIYLARFHWGARFDMLFRYAPPAAYVSTTIVWLLAFWHREVPVTMKELDVALFKRLADYSTKLAGQAEKDWRKLYAHLLLIFSNVPVSEKIDWI